MSRRSNAKFRIYSGYGRRFFSVRRLLSKIGGKIARGRAPVERKQYAAPKTASRRRAEPRFGGGTGA